MKQISWPTAAVAIVGIAGIVALVVVGADPGYLVLIVAGVLGIGLGQQLTQIKENTNGTVTKLTDANAKLATELERTRKEMLDLAKRLPPEA